MKHPQRESRLERIPLIGDWLARRLTSAPVVGVLRLSGVIGQAGIGRKGLTLDDLADSIERVFKLPKLTAVAISVNSPGGSPVQSALIATRIRALADEHDVPVYAFCEDVAASGGYWLACAADHIYAGGTSVIGSIGVISAGFGFPALLEKIGVERRVYTAGESKAMLDPFRPEDPNDIKRLTDIQVDVHEQFKDWIRERRGSRLKDKESKLFDGTVWSGRQAVEVGLVDGIGDLRAVMRDKLGDRVKLRPIRAPKNWLQKRFGMGGRSDLAADLIAAIEERLIWSRFGL